MKCFQGFRVMDHQLLINLVAQIETELEDEA
jgi:hypothetical protein